MIAFLIIFLSIWVMIGIIFCEDIWAFVHGKRFSRPIAPDIYSKDPVIESAAARLWNEHPELDPTDRVHFGKTPLELEAS